MKKNKGIILFLLIFSLAAFLRLFHLGSVPPGLNRDEASIGYTAYSILKTGRDEYGRFLPISFESFGDWKLPLYIYLDIPFVKFLGFTEEAVRLPSTLFGIGTVILTYFLTKRLTGNNVISFLSMGLLAISPWHLHFSRVAYEANAAVFFTTAALLLFLKGVKNNSIYLISSFVLFALTYYTYHGNHIFTTLLLIVLFALYFRELLKKRKETILGLSLFIILVGFILSQTLFRANIVKISGAGIFGDPAIVNAKIEIARNEDPKMDIISKLLHNRGVYATEKFLQNYILSYSANFLFINGGENKTHNIPNFGNMYLIEAPFLLIGFIFLLTKTKGKEKILMLLWLLIAPLPASITKDAPHSARMLVVMPMLLICVAMGMYWLWEFIRKMKFIKSIVVLFLALCVVANFSIYMDRYYIHFPIERADYWGYGYKELVKLLMKPQYNNTHIIIDQPETSPYIFLLFYGKIDPAVYQKEAIRYPITSEGFENVKQFKNFTFRQINWDVELSDRYTMLVGFKPDIASRFIGKRPDKIRVIQTTIAYPLATIVSYKPVK